MADPLLKDASIEGYDARTAISTQALNSESLEKDIKNILLQYSGLWE